MAWGLSESYSGYEGTGENMDLHTETWHKYWGNALEWNEDILIINEVILGQ